MRRYLPSWYLFAYIFWKLECHLTCLTCNGTTATNCLSCNNDRFLYQATCLTECPDGFYGDTSDNTCKRINEELIYPYLFNFFGPLACHSSCFTCDGGTANNCTSCNLAGTTYLYQSMCTTCPTIGYWPDDSDHVCKRINEELIYPYLFNFFGPLACHSSCFTCDGGTANNCTSCNLAGTTYLYQSMCTTCPTIGYWPDDSNHVCERINKSLIYSYLLKFFCSFSLPFKLLHMQWRSLQ